MSQFQEASSDVDGIGPSSQPCFIAKLGPEISKWSNAWLEIDSAAFEQNIERLKEHIGSHIEVCATMKADAYCHGIDLLMPSIIRMGIPGVGVSNNAEGLLVRRSGFKGRLLRLRTASLPEMVEGFKLGFEEILGNSGSAHALGCAARLRGATARIHLAINSGQMGRSDIETRTEHGRLQALEILKAPGLTPVGIMTHFALEEPSVLKRQACQFRDDAEWLARAAGLQREAVVFHAANSNALLDSIDL